MAQKTRTFINAGVLITAFQSKDPLLKFRALAVLNDLDREFASSPFVQLEVLPKAIFVRNIAEQQFYETFFASVSHWPTDIEQVIEMARTEGGKYGLNGMDALHVAAAFLVQADELVTIEKIGKSLHRAQTITIVTIS